MRDFRATGRRAARVVLVAFVGLAASLGLAAPQFNTTNGPTANLPIEQLDRSRMPDDQPYVSRELQARQLKRLREEHQKQVFSDTARLVQLATALKQQVYKGDKATLDAIKNVDEIGRLAKRVSERLKTQ